MALGYASSSGYSPTSGYDIAPAPTAGTGPYGQVPGVIGVPPNYWEQMSSIYPVAGQAGQASNVIGNQLAGQLSPEEIAAYQTYGAQFGVKSGSPMSGFAGRAGLLNVGRGVAETQQAGLTNYQNMLRALSGTLTPQELAAQIASRNATMRAAPDPQQAAEQQMQDWMTKFQMAMQAATPQTRTYGYAPQARFPYAGPAGGTATYSAPPTAAGVSPYVRPVGTPDIYNLDLPGVEVDPYADMPGYEVPYSGVVGTPTLDWTPEELIGMGMTGPDVMGYYDQPAYDDMAAYPGWYEDVGYYDTGSDYYPTNYDYTYDFGY